MTWTAALQAARWLRCRRSGEAFHPSCGSFCLRTKFAVMFSALSERRGRALIEIIAHPSLANLPKVGWASLDNSDDARREMVPKEKAEA